MSQNDQLFHRAPEQFAAHFRQRAEEAIAASVHHASLTQQFLACSQKATAFAEQAAAGNAFDRQVSAACLQADFQKRAEEAMSASVHHASLSQQYLTLSQKFAAIVEQSLSGNATDVHVSAAQLEREAVTGLPAAPLGVAQVPVSVDTCAALFGSDSRDPFESPSARFSNIGDSPGAGHVSPGSSSATLAHPGLSSTEPLSPEISVGERSAVKATTTEHALAISSPITAKSKNSKNRVSVRKLLERTRMVTLERTERVRVKARKSDLKRQLRNTSEEIQEVFVRSRVPASISMIVTAFALLTLAFFHLEFVETAELPPIIAGFSEKIEPVEETLPIEPPLEEVGRQQEIPEEEMAEESEPEPEPTPEPETDPNPEPDPASMPEIEVAELSLPETKDGVSPASSEAAADNGASVDNRSEAGRKVLVEKFGGSAASESAVGYALEWLTARQRANGTWDFIDAGPCTHAGSVNNPIGGTAYALLPFLAAGQTHKEGQYKKQVQAGLEFLKSIGVQAPAGYDLRGVINKADDDEDPNYAYYVHGAATLALCEAYGMTKDRKLKPFAEGAIKFLVNSQDPRGGGWRYNPQQSGSTSATAVQLIALKAGEKAGIRIPESTWKGVTHYLDSVSVDRQGRYGYELEKKSYTVSVTSMAMLSRMYLGWGRDDGDLRAGVALIDKRGPYDNLYYNYFATQVLKNWGGAEWDRWNGRLRDDLIAWQEQEGVSKGSWMPRDRDDYSRAGGRLLTTCLATLTLEVYYRYQPLLPEISLTTIREGEPPASPFENASVKPAEDDPPKP